MEPPLVLPQLRCSGVIETVKIRRSGFAVRMTYVSFAAAFSVLLPKSQGGTKPEGDGNAYSQNEAEELLRMGLEMKKPSGDPRALTQAVLGHCAGALSSLPEPFRQYVFGNTKLFIKSDKMLQKLEWEREQVLGVIRERLKKLHEEQERKRKEAEARAQADRAKKVAEEQARAEAQNRAPETIPDVAPVKIAGDDKLRAVRICIRWCCCCYCCCCCRCCCCCC
jgi:myosin heavy subunit